MKLKDLHIAYFIGIGGIGMSAIARWFNQHGVAVHGYDRVETPLTKILSNEGIAIHYEDSIELLPEELKRDKSGSLIVYTPAIPNDHRQFNHLLEAGYEVMKRSQVLGLITKNTFTVAVAGTHGKTTTSSMVAHLLKNSGRDIAAFLGGLTTNYNSNFIINETLDDKTISVVEADEFDRSFLTLFPDMAIITSMDADHLDIYGDKESLRESFGDFICQIKEGGYLFINDHIEYKGLAEDALCVPANYGINRGQFFAVNLRISGDTFVFDFSSKGRLIKGLSLCVPGYHNVENMVAAIAVAAQLGLNEEEIKQGVASYKGVKRRFEYIHKKDGVIYIDDYAHHPTEITAFLKSVKEMYAGKNVLAIFQPHLYSRTRDFARDFSKSLSLADEVLLLDIYPARELPIPGVTSAMLFEDIDTKKQLCKKEEVLKVLEDKEIEVIVTLGAGDINQLVEPIKEYLTNRYSV
jgi:UDP-N-acetylmuramate--alanine ligase